MRGQDALLSLRRRGWRPERGVIVHTDDQCPRLLALGGEFPAAAHLWIGPDEQVERLDLRCLFDLKVLVIADKWRKPRAVQIAQRCAEAHAKRAIAAKFDQSTEVLFDSAGELAANAWAVA